MSPHTPPPISSQNTTLLIAGPWHSNIELMVKRYRGVFGEIIVSTWEAASVPNEIAGATVVQSATPNIEKAHNSQNIYLQTRSTLAGLTKTVTAYVFKVRSDETWSNLDQILTSFSPNKLNSSNVFVRDVSYKKFHISDHLYFGQTAHLVNSFSQLSDYLISQPEDSDRLSVNNAQTPAEVKITLFYLAAIGYDPSHLINLSAKQAWNVMSKELHIFDIEPLKPYKISSSVAGNISCLNSYIKRDRVLFLRQVSNINDLKPRNRVMRLYDRIIFKLRKYRP